MHVYYFISLLYFMNVYIRLWGPMKCMSPLLKLHRVAFHYKSRLDLQIDNNYITFHNMTAETCRYYVCLDVNLCLHKGSVWERKPFVIFFSFLTSPSSAQEFHFFFVISLIITLIRWPWGKSLVEHLRDIWERKKHRREHRLTLDLIISLHQSLFRSFLPRSELR